MRRNVLPKFLEICMDLYGGRKPTETYAYATEVCYKSVNLSLGELKNIKITLFLIPELLKKLNSQKQVTFLTNMTALSAVM